MFTKEHGITYPHGPGEAFAAAYGIDRSGIPAMFVIDAAGRITDYFIEWQGDVTRTRLAAAIEELLRKAA